eukprot:1202491-Rhodomonas_salina.3
MVYHAKTCFALTYGMMLQHVQYWHIAWCYSIIYGTDIPYGTRESLCRLPCPRPLQWRSLRGGQPELRYLPTPTLCDVQY